MKRGLMFSAALLCVWGGVAILHATAEAKQFSFKQRILPLECLYEEVNDGLGTLRYLTPAECGVVLTPTIPEEPQNTQTPTEENIKKNSQLFLGRVNAGREQGRVLTEAEFRGITPNIAANDQNSARTAGTGIKTATIIIAASALAIIVVVLSIISL